jgi:hypothetical protein
MSLLDSLKDKAIKEISDEEKQKEWIDKGFDAAIADGHKLLPAEEVGEDKELEAVRKSGEFALAKLEKHKGALVKLGQHGLRSTLGALSLGDYDGAAQHAALVALRKTASWDEVSAAIVGTAEAGNEAKRELDAAIKEVTDALKDIGVVAAKTLFSLFVALV